MSDPSEDKGGSTLESDERLIEARSFHQSFASLLMATVNARGEPTASYAPYVTDERGHFLIYVSELAPHTANLLDSGRVSVLFIEEESCSQQIYARRRITYDCQAEAIPRSDPRFEEALSRLAERHGEIVPVLKGLQDFHLFRLVPLGASYVKGFAQAYRLAGPALASLAPVNERGHRSG